MSSSEQQAFMAQTGLTMAEKLRLWKAHKAKQGGAATAAPAAKAAAPVAKAPVAKVATAKAASAAPAKSAAAAVPIATKAATKRPFAAVTTTDKEKSSKVVKSAVATKKAKTSSSVEVKAKRPEIAPAQPAAACTEESMEEDANEDLGISFSSTEGTPPPVSSSSSSSRLALNSTPVATSLRAQLMAESDDTDMEAVAPVPIKRVTSDTPRAQALREALALTPPSAFTRSASNASMTPVATALARELRNDFSTAAAATPSGRIMTPHADRLREALSRRTPPTASRLTATSCTPVAASLARQLLVERTPPEEKGSMAALLKSSQNIVSAVLVAPRSSVASAESSPDSSMQRDDDVVSLLGASPAAYLDSSIDSIESNHESRDVVRNLMSEMTDDLNSSNHSLGLSGDLASVDGLNTSLCGGSLDSSFVEAKDLSCATSSIFQEDEFIAGLSTPAQAASKYAYAAMAQHVQLFSAEEDSPTQSPAQSPAPTPSKHARLLTPSKAHLQHAHPLEGGSSVVMASVRAHPRDAARMGSATFLSPVRRSTRHKADAASPNVEDMDQADLTALLERNNYAYRPNPTLSRQLTPIPQQRRAKHVHSAAMVDQMECIEEVVASSPVSVARSAPQPSTPIPSGSSLVVLQAVRSNRRRASTSAASPAAVDPRSAEYLLSPVRRSARHTAPQSLADLTKLLATTQYAYRPNPLLETAPTPAAAAAAAITSPQMTKSLAAIEEEESEEQEASSSSMETALPEDDVCMISSLTARLAARAASATTTTRIGTPLPNRKQPMSIRTIVVDNLNINWEKSYGSGSTGSSTANGSNDIASKHSKSPQVVNARDADGFLVPLPKQRKSNKRGRSGSSLDDLETKLSLVAVTMLEQSYRGAPVSASASTSAVPHGVTRMATPRPATKRQKMMYAHDQVGTGTYQDTRQDTPSTRRSARVATPIR